MISNRLTKVVGFKRKQRYSSSAETAVRVCIVGAGPAGTSLSPILLRTDTVEGYYTAAALLQANKNVRIDFIEKLPTPFGLVRSGVAPDHQDVCIIAVFHSSDVVTGEVSADQIH